MTLKLHPAAVAALLLAGLVLVAHLRAVEMTPLPDYGWRGAPFLEHTQRAYALSLAEGLGPVEAIWTLPGHVRALDGEYPALLHALSARWGLALGEDARGQTLPQDWALPLHLNLGWILMLILGALLALGALEDRLWGAGRRDPTGDVPGERALRRGALALALLSCPGIFAVARRYYYDLPMAAWLALFMGLLLGGARRPGLLPAAALALAAACLTKWHALVFALPILAFYWLALAQEGRGLRGALEGLGVLAVAALIAGLPWLGAERWPESLGRVLGEVGAALGGSQAGGGSGSRRSGLALGLGREGVMGILGLGTAVTLGAAALFAALGSGGPGRRWGILLLGVVVLPPAALLGLTAPVADGRFLIPLVAPLALAVVVMAGPLGLRLLSVGLSLAGILHLVDVDLRPLDLTTPTRDARGWSRPEAGAGLHPEAYLDALAPLCAPDPPPGVRALLLDSEADRDAGFAWRWAAARRCPGVDVVSMEAPSWGVAARSHGRGWVPIPHPDAPGGRIFVKAWDGDD